MSLIEYWQSSNGRDLMIDFKALNTTANSSISQLSEHELNQINAQVANQLNTGIMVLDVEFNVVTWNRFLQVHSDTKAEDIVGQSLFQAFPELPERWLTRKLNSVIQLNTPSFCSWQQRHHLFELPHTRPITTDSEFMAQNCTFLPIEIDSTQKHICILIEDVTDVCHYQTQLQKTLDELAQMSRIDGLTKIYNRRHWEESLHQEVAKAFRHDKKLSLIMLDLDHFKRLNDNYGHQCGDMVLVDVSALIGNMLRVEDTFGRYGGEEFSIILPETSLAGAIDLAERICRQVDENLFKYNGQNLEVTISLGVAQLTDSIDSSEALISKADSALYQAKAEGRNKVSNGLIVKR